MVEVYITDIRQWNEEAMYRKWLAAVPKERRQRAESYRRAEDKRRSLAGTILAGRAFADRYPDGKLCRDMPVANCQFAFCRFAECKFVYGESGKPYLEGHPTFHFNLSHSGNYAVCAVSEQETGVDIQKLRNVKSDIASRFFSSEERKQMQGMEKTDMLFRIWSAKESYVKLTGRGLQDLQNFSVNLQEGRVQDYRMPDAPEVRLKEYKAPAGYVLSVCTFEKVFGGLHEYTIESDNTGQTPGIC